jgi:sodium transport system permease protein
MEPTKLICSFDKTNIGYEQRAQKYVQYIEAEERLKRYQTLNIDEQQITPFEIAFENSASNQKMIGELVGGFLPYIFIAFGFMGCMYPAIDLFTGEKERGTIETLLTTPVSRWKFLIGKMLVIILSGLMASFFALLGLFFSINFMDIIPDPEIMNVINQILSLGFVLKLFLLLLPLTVFFAGIMIPIAVYTKTFKEAQSIIAPLNIIVLLPAMAGLFPGIELNVQTALIPILNIVLTTKGLIGGTIDYSLLILSFSVMVVLAGIAVAVSFKQFGKETNILS